MAHVYGAVVSILVQLPVLVELQLSIRPQLCQRWLGYNLLEKFVVIAKVFGLTALKLSHIMHGVFGGRDTNESTKMVTFLKMSLRNEVVLSAKIIEQNVLRFVNAIGQIE